MINQRNLLGVFLLSLSMTCAGLDDATITVDDLNVRNLPRGEVIEKLNRNEPVQVTSEEDGWSKIVYKSNESGLTAYGWVASEYIEYAFEAEKTQCFEYQALGQELCLATMEPSLECNRLSSSLSYSDCSVDIRYEVSGADSNINELDVSCTVSLTTKKLSNGEPEEAAKPTAPPGIHVGGELNVRINANVDVSGSSNRGEFYVRSRTGATMIKPDGTVVEKISSDDREILTDFEGSDSPRSAYLMWSDTNVFDRFPELTQGNSYREVNIIMAEYDWDTGTWYAHDNTDRVAFLPLYTDVVIAGFMETSGGISDAVLYGDLIDFVAPSSASEDSVEDDEWLTSEHSNSISHSLSETLRESMALNIEFSDDRPVSYARLDDTECKLVL